MIRIRIGEGWVSDAGVRAGLRAGTREPRRAAIRSIVDVLAVEVEGVDIAAGRTEGPLAEGVLGLLVAVARLAAGEEHASVAFDDGAVELLLHRRGGVALLSVATLSRPARLLAHDVEVDLPRLAEAAREAAIEFCSRVAEIAPGARALPELRRLLRAASRSPVVAGADAAPARAAAPAAPAAARGMLPAASRSTTSPAGCPPGGESGADLASLLVRGRLCFRSPAGEEFLRVDGRPVPALPRPLRRLVPHRRIARGHGLLRPGAPGTERHGTGHRGGRIRVGGRCPTGPVRFPRLRPGHPRGSHGLLRGGPGPGARTRPATVSSSTWSARPRPRSHRCSRAGRATGRPPRGVACAWERGAPSARGPSRQVACAGSPSGASRRPRSDHRPATACSGRAACSRPAAGIEPSASTPPRAPNAGTARAPCSPPPETEFSSSSAARCWRGATSGAGQSSGPEPHRRTRAAAAGSSSLPAAPCSSWRARSCPPSSRPAASRSGRSSLRAPPACPSCPLGPLLVAASDTGMVHAIDPTGKVAWRLRGAGPARGARRRNGAVLLPLVPHARGRDPRVRRSGDRGPHPRGRPRLHPDVPPGAPSPGASPWPAASPATGSSPRSSPAAHTRGPAPPRPATPRPSLPAPEGSSPRDPTAPAPRSTGTAGSSGSASRAGRPAPPGNLAAVGARGVVLVPADEVEVLDAASGVVVGRLPSHAPGPPLAGRRPGRLDARRGRPALRRARPRAPVGRLAARP